MTERRRKQIAIEYRRELDRRAKKGEPRKAWVPEWLRERGISRRSLYNYAKRHGINIG